MKGWCDAARIKAKFFDSSNYMSSSIFLPLTYTAMFQIIQVFQMFQVFQLLNLFMNEVIPSHWQLLIVILPPSSICFLSLVVNKTL